MLKNWKFENYGGLYIPIILCTGYSSIIDEHSAKALGIKEFVLKPLTKGVISKLIRKLLDVS